MANIKKIKVGSETHDIEALHFITGDLDTPASWKSYIDAAAHVGIEIVIDEKSSQGDYPATPASASTMGKLYMVDLNDSVEPGTYTEFVTVQSQGGLTYAWEKIGTTAVDLDNYVQKGTYTSAGPSSNATGSAGGETITTSSAGSQTATGTAKIDNHTISAHSHTVNAATTNANTDAIKDIGLTPSDTTTDGPKYVQEVSLGGTKTFNTDAIKDVTLSASDTSSDGPAYISSVSGTFNTDAIKNVTLSASETSTDGPAFVESISGDAPRLGGTKTFVTGYGSFSGGSGAFTPTTRYMKVTTTATSAADKGTVTLSGGSCTGTFNTGAIKSISGTKNYGFSSSTSNVMSAPTVDANGVLSWSVSSASTQDAHTGDAASTASVSYTAPTLGGTTSFLTTAVKSATLSASTTSTDGPKYIQEATHSHTGASLGTASTGTVSLEGGEYTATIKYMKRTTTAASTASVSKTTKYMKHTNTSASTGTVSISPTTKYMKHTTTAASKTAVMTSATLSTAGGTTLTHTGTGTTTVPVTVAVGDHTHTVTTSNHTHTLGNHTHNTTLN